MGVVVLDWDNTIVDGDSKLLPGAREAITTLRNAGHKVIIASCNDPKWIKKCLNEFGLPVDKVWDNDSTNPKSYGKGNKPLGDLYVDDKGYHFPHNGDWSSQIGPILERVKDKDNRKW
jgi:hypothetical protein